MAKQFKNTLMELFIFTEDINSCPPPLQEEKIQLIIKAAIRRTYCRAFSEKGATKETQESVLAMLKILEARPRIKSMEYLDIEENIEKIKENTDRELSEIDKEIDNILAVLDACNSKINQLLASEGV